VFALLTWLIWREQRLGLLFVAAAGPPTVAGTWLGERIYCVPERPSVKSVLWLLVLAALVTPFATGIVDLSLRRLTP